MKHFCCCSDTKKKWELEWSFKPDTMWSRSLRCGRLHSEALWLWTWTLLPNLNLYLQLRIVVIGVVEKGVITLMTASSILQQISLRFLRRERRKKIGGKSLQSRVDSYLRSVCDRHDKSHTKLKIINCSSSFVGSRKFFIHARLQNFVGFVL